MNLNGNEYNILVNEAGNHTCALHDNHNKLLTTEGCESECKSYYHCDTIAWANDEHKLMNDEAWRCECGRINNHGDECEGC
jgi:hypothetical protein